MKTETKKLEGFSRYIICSDSTIFDTKKGIEVKKYKIATGYIVVHLYKDGDKKQGTYNLHRLIANTFIENPDPKILVEVAHIDDDKDNNCVDNLKWSTKKDNRQTPRGINPLSELQKKIFKKYYQNNKSRWVIYNVK